MKNSILYIVIILFACVLIGCNPYEYQKGVVVDVHYVNHVKPCWVAHVHYNDTICVYQNFNNKVSQGQVVYRKTRVKPKQYTNK